MPGARARLRHVAILMALHMACGFMIGCTEADRRSGESTSDSGQQAGLAPQAAASAPPDARADALLDAAVGALLDAAVGALPDANPNALPDAPAAGEVRTDQVLPGLRPEFLDYFWNNLDPARFEQWHPAAHETFAWTRAPKVPGDLGAELGASYTARVTIAGAPHDLRVSYVEPQLKDDGVTLESAMAAEVWVDGTGPLRLVVQYEQQGEDVRVLQRFALPLGAAQAEWRGYLEERMKNVAAFIREPFQKQYVEMEITKRGEIKVTSDVLDIDVVVTQKIGKVTPQMVDWWWDNMGGTERYRHWHPTAHQSFTWTTPPKNSKDLLYDVGSVQKIVEVIGESSTLNITWLDPAQLPIPKTYANFIYGETNLDGTPFGGFLVHEYEAVPEGGIVMKSTFRVPSLSGDTFAQALGEHCVQEMQFLQYYLPRLFAKEYMP